MKVGSHQWLTKLGLLIKLIQSFTITSLSHQSKAHCDEKGILKRFPHDLCEGAASNSHDKLGFSTINKL